MSHSIHESTRCVVTKPKSKLPDYTVSFSKEVRFENRIAMGTIGFKTLTLSVANRK
jgi:hypothetical protein